MDGLKFKKSAKHKFGPDYKPHPASLSTELYDDGIGPTCLAYFKGLIDSKQPSIPVKKAAKIKPIKKTSTKVHTLIPRRKPAAKRFDSSSSDSDEPMQDSDLDAPIPISKKKKAVLLTDSDSEEPIHVTKKKKSIFTDSDDESIDFKKTISPTKIKPVKPRIRPISPRIRPRRIRTTKPKRNRALEAKKRDYFLHEFGYAINHHKGGRIRAQNSIDYAVSIARRINFSPNMILLKALVRTIYPEMKNEEYVDQTASLIQERIESVYEVQLIPDKGYAEGDSDSDSDSNTDFSQYTDSE
jgi:hypothetical protein